jgi:uncharacterized membrane protein
MMHGLADNIDLHIQLHTSLNTMSLSTQFTPKRPRLFVALLAGILIALVLPRDWNLITRILSGWNAGVWSYLALMGWLITKADHAQIQRISAQEDKSAIAVLAIMSISAVLSLAAIGFELVAVSNMAMHERISHYALTIITVLSSWLLVGIIFAFHYAHMFYLSNKTMRAFRFPENKPNPDYWDFLYLAFTIAAAAQTSDVSIMNSSARKAVTAQSILSFIFNAAVIGLLINIAAGIIGSH